jgi:hypothetical protein
MQHAEEARSAASWPCLLNLCDFSGKTRSRFNVGCGQSGIAPEFTRHRNFKIALLSNIDFAIASRASQYNRFVRR